MIQPFVSVIITTYNRPQLLPRAVASVLMQEGVGFELLVIDDGSLEGDTRAVAEGFRDTRIHYIHHEQNRGSAESLNHGLREAKGGYIAILDDDDEWIVRDKLMKQVEFLENNPDHVAVATQVIIIEYTSGETIKKSSYPMEDNAIRKNFLSFNPIAHSSILYRAHVARDMGGYDVSLSRGKDYDLILKIADRGKIAILPDHAVRYRESTFQNCDLFSLRLRDTRAKISIIMRHKDRYPHFLSSLIQECMRLITFSFLKPFSFFFRK